MENTVWRNELKEEAFFAGKSAYCFYPTLTGSKTSASRFERNKEDKREITARKGSTKDRTSKSGEATGCGVLSVISLANHQWG